MISADSNVRLLLDHTGILRFNHPDHSLQTVRYLRTGCDNTWNTPSNTTLCSVLSFRCGSPGLLGTRASERSLWRRHLWHAQNGYWFGTQPEFCRFCCCAIASSEVSVGDHSRTDLQMKSNELTCTLLIFTFRRRGPKT